jgi:hypothetical protein
MELEQERLNVSAERNFYLDTILKVVFDKARGRNLYFSSFDPDICILLARKQVRYPVILFRISIYNLRFSS